MPSEKYHELEELLTALRMPKVSCSIRMRKAKLYDIDPWEFLGFAKQDLVEDSDRARVNGLSNAKRAIECRLDEFLTFYHLRHFAVKGHWGLNYKIQVAKAFGISAPDVLLRYIGSKRNLVEHEYVRPQANEEVKYVADIVELFLKASDLYVRSGYIASATIVYPTGDESVKKTRSREIHCLSFFQYNLAFDEDDAIKVDHSRYSSVQEHSHATGEVREYRQNEVPQEKPLSTVIPVEDCKPEDFKELLLLLIEKRTKPSMQSLHI